MIAKNSAVSDHQETGTVPIFVAGTVRSIVGHKNGTVPLWILNVAAAAIMANARANSSECVMPRWPTPFCTCQ